MGLYDELAYKDKGRISADFEVSKPQLKKVAHHGAYGFWSSEDTHRFVIYMLPYSQDAYEWRRSDAGRVRALAAHSRGKHPYQRKIQRRRPLANIDRSIDTMLQSILLLFVSRKPAIQGVCPFRVFKILCIAGFYCVLGLLRHSQFKARFEYPRRKNKIVLWKITEYKEK